MSLSPKKKTGNFYKKEKKTQTELHTFLQNCLNLVFHLYG